MGATVIAIALQKGGVGKTTTAQALASTLGFKKKKTLLIDMDSQCDVTNASGIDLPEKSITDVLGKECTPEDAVIHCKYYDLLAADPYLTNVEMSEVEPTLLKNSIKSLQNQYDFIVIDTPPALGNLSVNSMVASDYVIIPCEPRPFALRGLGALHNTIQMVQSSLNPKLKVLGILLIKFNKRTILSRNIKDMIDEYAKLMDSSLFETTIREGISAAEAQIVRKPLIDYARNSKPNIDYKAFAAEVLKKIGE